MRTNCCCSPFLFCSFAVFVCVLVHVGGDGNHDDDQIRLLLFFSVIFNISCTSRSEKKRRKQS